MTYLGDISLVVVVVALTGSSVHHLLAWRRFRAELLAQRVVPSRWVTPVAVAVTLVELCLGGTLAAIAVGAVTGGAGRVVPALAAALFAAYAVHTAILVRTRPGAPCACGTAGRPASLWTVLRAAALCAAALASVGAGGFSRNTAAETIYVLTMGFTLVVVVWLVPDALHVPGWTGTADKYAEVRS